MPGFWRIVLVVATSATGAGIAGLHAQTALTDPKDSRTIFATTCTACHKSPQGLAKSGQVAGFLRQHYTTGPEMSAAMAAYLVAAGSGPAPKQKGEKKEGATASAENPAAKSKSKKQEQAEQAALSQPGADTKDRNARGKQRLGKQDEPSPARPAATTPDQPAAIVTPEPVRQAAAPAAPAAPAPVAAAPAAPAPAAEPLVTFDLPLPPMPDGPPADLTNQTGFSSSPVP